MRIYIACNKVDVLSSLTASPIAVRTLPVSKIGETSLLALANAYCPISLTDAGILSSTSFQQLWNACKD